jgi:hypothetical protein
MSTTDGIHYVRNCTQSCSHQIGALILDICHSIVREKNQNRVVVGFRGVGNLFAYQVVLSGLNAQKELLSH